MPEIMPWWVVSDPDHPVNAHHPVPEAPKMSEPESGVPPHIAQAVEIAQSTTVSQDERDHAVEVLRAWDASHAPVGDAHPSTIPDDLIPAGFRATPDGAI